MEETPTGTGKNPGDSPRNPPPSLLTPAFGTVPHIVENFAIQNGQKNDIPDVLKDGCLIAARGAIRHPNI